MAVAVGLPEGFEPDDVARDEAIGATFVGAPDAAGAPPELTEAIEALAETDALARLVTFDALGVLEGGAEVAFSSTGPEGSVVGTGDRQ